jgi:hypothetical protein
VQPGEKKALKDIDKYGCHVIHVLGEEEHPPFTYSIGVQLKTGAPEILVIGMKRPVAHFIVNEYNSRAASAKRFMHGERASGFLEGFDVEFRDVHPSHFGEHFGWALWLYRGDNFRVVQAVFPTTGGVWPWEEQASDSFRHIQPVLDEPAT